MRAYESTIAFHPQCGDDAIQELLERAQEAIARNGGEVKEVADWGLRDMAYPIQHQRRAAFRIVVFQGDGKVVAELERNLRIFDPVLRYITVRIDPDRPPISPPAAARPPRGGDEASSEAAPAEPTAPPAAPGADA